MTALLLALVGCDPPDRELYLAAAGASPREAAALCERVDDPGLGGDCLTHAAGGLARDGRFGDAFALCERVQSPVWRDECRFLAVDEAGLVGEIAVEHCHKTGRFRAHCLGHAIGREVEEAERRYGAVGLEPELEHEIGTIVERYKPGAPDDQRAVTVEGLLARILAARGAPAPFDVARCGRAPASRCAAAYRVDLEGTPREVDLAALCGAPVTRARVEGAGLRSWADGSEEVALAAWTALCAELAEGRLDRAGAPGGVAGPPPPGSLPGGL